MFAPKFVDELFRPEQMYAYAITRQIFDRLCKCLRNYLSIYLPDSLPLLLSVLLVTYASLLDVAFLLMLCPLYSPFVNYAT